MDEPECKEGQELFYLSPKQGNLTTVLSVKSTKDFFLFAYISRVTVKLTLL